MLTSWRSARPAFGGCSAIAGLLSKWNGESSRKGIGFAQPLAAHQHWHIDVSDLNIGGTFHYLCSILDGYSRYIVQWDMRESMNEADIEIVALIPGARVAAAVVPLPFSGSESSASFNVVGRAIAPGD